MGSYQTLLFVSLTVKWAMPWRHFGEDIDLSMPWSEATAWDLSDEERKKLYEENARQLMRLPI